MAEDEQLSLFDMTDIPVVPVALTPRAARAAYLKRIRSFGVGGDMSILCRHCMHLETQVVNRKRSYMCNQHSRVDFNWRDSWRACGKYELAKASIALRARRYHKPVRDAMIAGWKTGDDLALLQKLISMRLVTWRGWAEPTLLGEAVIEALANLAQAKT